MQETEVRSQGGEDIPKKEMATHSTILAWENPWTEEPGRLQSVGWQRATNTYTHKNTYIFLKCRLGNYVDYKVYTNKLKTMR